MFKFSASLAFFAYALQVSAGGKQICIDRKTKLFFSIFFRHLASLFFVFAFAVSFSVAFSVAFAFAAAFFQVQTKGRPVVHTAFQNRLHPFGRSKNRRKGLYLIWSREDSNIATKCGLLFCKDQQSGLNQRRHRRIL